MKYEMGQTIKNIVSGQSAPVRGRAEYAHAEPSYHVVIKDDKGQAGFAWWEESLVEPVKDAPVP